MATLDILIKNMVYLRKKNGWNQEKLAKELNTNRSVIGSYEQKIAKPSIEVLMQLHEIFKIELSDLLYTPLELIEEQKLNNNEKIVILSKKISYMYNEINQLKKK